MDHPNGFLIATIVLDVVLLSLTGVFSPPLDPRVYGVFVTLVVSPVLSYLFVTRVYDRAFGV